ncbi:MAG TPA: peptide chain release factor N(5)-glutamine methyltransferase [Afipia sp.]|uniref:peptide chain release factor N(5)-glutamine methyltransferase n=1 Tax=unclassified Afipia TaxID=2642050 RepID=UPI000464D4F8|nr:MULTISPECIES: peptide chain release factor N(5)-glutamine methyltransferase [unclassified Afipia]MAH68171.1 protein-(glutamine-N5) methyltransferase, release factor-specific [Afipia sp.]OUX62748.1 MAG: protein-(glutamine-N5) methyltransferase, release factor-specific [Afipia sp. TMED4]HAP11072.1 peptide chain release factor N(5)-glutamine methyltransferase [Afipia sp.]HAQ94345.1 peptide chain release factor N(5)-glutamine methyltransferase [Afipia sp.]HBF56160.1 peptide chain release factor
MSASDPFAGLTIEASRRALAAQFKARGIETPELDARLLIGAALDLDHTALAAQAARLITSQESKAIARFAQRRMAHEPVARILGRKEFWGLDFRLSAATLVPRPDTETVIEAALEFFQNFRASAVRIADIGTGSGAILLALLSEFPEATGVGTDISAEALATAELNARRFDLAGRASFVQCDYAAALSGPFDLIVSNPPYIPSSHIATLDHDVRDHDPILALDGGTDGLDAYRAIIPQAAALLGPGGVLIVETGHDQSTPVSDLMRAAKLTLPRPPVADLGGIHRAVMGRKAAF